MANDKAKQQELKDARAALERAGQGDTETDAFHKANARVIKAEKALPWHKR